MTEVDSVQQERGKMSRDNWYNKNTVSTGIGVGNVAAAILSWTWYHSFWWMILHGWLGWFYIIYAYFCGYFLRQ